MISINAHDLADAWKKTLIELNENGKENEDMFRDEVVVLEIEKNENDTHPLFPMNDLLDDYKKHIITGKGKNVLSEHVMYHKRIFDQMDFVIKTLQNEPLSKRALISLWDPKEDHINEKVPCIQILWFRIVDGMLEMHVHMRANDAYKKLLMNLAICGEVMKYVARRLGISCGRYVHIVDSMHIYRADEGKIDEVLSLF